MKLREKTFFMVLGRTALMIGIIAILINGSVNKTSTNDQIKYQLRVGIYAVEQAYEEEEVNYDS